jgi:hypothetical protein
MASSRLASAIWGPKKSRSGQANFVLMSANRKTANFWVRSANPNAQIYQVCQSAKHKSENLYDYYGNPQIPTKYCATLSRNSPKSRFCLQI